MLSLVRGSVLGMLSLVGEVFGMLSLVRGCVLGML